MNTKQYAKPALSYLPRSLQRNVHFDLAADEAAIAPILANIEKVATNVEAQMEAIKNVSEKTSALEARMVELDGVKAQMDATRLMLKTRAGDIPGLEDEKQTFDIGKLLQVRKGIANRESIGFELEVLVESHKKYSNGGYSINKDGIISTLTGSDGGIALPVEVSKTIIEAARAQSQLSKLGTYFPQLAGLSSFTVPLEEPTDLSSDGIIMQAAPTGEGAALPVRSPKWKAESFAPKKLGMIIAVTNEFIKEGGQFLVDYVRNKAATDMANKLEYNVLNGTGEQGQVPRGILSRTDLAATTLAGGAITGNGRALSFSDLVSMEQTILNENRLVEGGKFGYYMRSSLALGLRTQFSRQSEDGTVLNSLPITPLQFASVKKLAEFVGYEMAYSTLIPTLTQGSSLDASSILFGDWSKVWVPFWGPMEMLMSNVASVGSMSGFQNDMTFVRFVQMYDVGVVAPNALTKVSGFTPVTPAS